MENRKCVNLDPRVLQPGELPDDEALVPGGGEDHVRELWAGGQLGHPALVAPQGASQHQTLAHPSFDKHLSEIITACNIRNFGASPAMAEFAG